MRYVSTDEDVINPRTIVGTSSSRSTAGITASSSAVVSAVLGRPAFKYETGVLSHGDPAPIVETYQRLTDADQDNVPRIPMQHYQLSYHKYYGLSACRSTRHVCIPQSLYHS
jgi:hypothetical protein